MGATNRTTNYNLPQFVATDVPTWLTDVTALWQLLIHLLKA